MFYRNIIIFSNKTSKLRLNLCGQCLYRLMSTELNSKPTNKLIKTSRKPRINDYYLCIKDEKLAKLVAKHITSDLPDNSVIFESCPGSGVLTKQLLKSNAQSIRLFEDNPKYLTALRALKRRHPNRLQIIDKQILNFRKFLDDFVIQYEHEVDYWFQNIAVKDWRSEPTIRFVAILSPKSSLFLRYIIKILLRRDMFFRFGRTQLFVVISESEYKYMNSKPENNYNEYRSTSVLYNTLFDIQTLETIPYSAFEIYTKSLETLPQNQIIIKDLNQLKENAKLIRLTPKLYLDEFDEQTLQDFYFFVKQTFMKRKQYVIPFLENWFPNCGPDLIWRGIPVFKYFGDLKPEEVLDLFKYLYNRSDYQNSLYKIFAMREDIESVEYTKEHEEHEDIDLKDKKRVTDTSNKSEE